MFNYRYRSDDDSNVDDISEGISIISESESAGRASPLAIKANLNSVNLNDYSNQENMSSNSKLQLPIHIPQSSYLLSSTMNTPEENSIRHRRIRHSSEIPEPKALNPRNVTSIVERSMHPLIRHSLKVAFSICVGLAILAFIGKLRNPDWQPWLVSKNLSVLEEKLTNLEIKNNLMRAEIDILSKQVSYLSTLWEKGKNIRGNFEKVQKSQHHHYKQTAESPMKQRSKTFNAWSGNGDNIDPVKIRKNDLKRSFKCPNENFREIAGICVERTESNIKNMEDFCDDVVVEQIFEDIELLKEDSGTDEAVNLDEPSFSKANPSDIYMFKDSQNSNKKEQYISENKYDTTRYWKQHQHLYSEEDEDINTYGEESGRKKISSKQRFGKRYKERSGENMLKGHFHKDLNSDRGPRISAERLPKSGEWHGKLMKQREAARNENEFRQRKKNWYIERGNEREKMRHS